MEKENPLYQGFAKYYNGSTSVGPCWMLDNETDIEFLKNALLKLQVYRKAGILAEYEYPFSDSRRTLKDLGFYLFEDRQFSNGVALFYGCNRSLGDQFTLNHGDQVELSLSLFDEPLVNIVK